MPLGPSSPLKTATSSPPPKSAKPCRTTPKRMANTASSISPPNPSLISTTPPSALTSLCALTKKSNTTSAASILSATPPPATKSSAASFFSTRASSSTSAPGNQHPAFEPARLLRSHRGRQGRRDQTQSKRGHGRPYPEAQGKGQAVHRFAGRRQRLGRHVHRTHLPDQQFSGPRRNSYLLRAVRRHSAQLHVRLHRALSFRPSHLHRLHDLSSRYSFN